MFVLTWQYSGPRDGEPIGVHAHFLQQLDILLSSTNADNINTDIYQYERMHALLEVYIPKFLS